MARPKSPKNTLVKETITSGSFPSSPETSVGLAEAPWQTREQKARKRRTESLRENQKSSRTTLAPTWFLSA